MCRAALSFWLVFYIYFFHAKMLHMHNDIYASFYLFMYACLFVLQYTENPVFRRSEASAMAIKEATGRHALRLKVLEFFKSVSNDQFV